MLYQLYSGQFIDKGSYIIINGPFDKYGYIVKKQDDGKIAVCHTHRFCSNIRKQWADALLKSYREKNYNW